MKMNGCLKGVEPHLAPSSRRLPTRPRALPGSANLQRKINRYPKRRLAVPRNQNQSRLSEGDFPAEPPERFKLKCSRVGVSQQRGLPEPRFRLRLKRGYKFLQ